MPNPHYQAGVRFERKLINLLKEHLPKEKYTIIRTAGSHSPVDVVVIEHLGQQGQNRSFGIQCKTVKKGSKAPDLKKYGVTKNVTKDVHEAFGVPELIKSNSIKS